MRGWVAALAVCAVLTAGAAAAQTNETPRPEDGYYEVVSRLAPGVWLIAQPKFQVQPTGNVTVIEQKDGLVLVDSGGSPGAGRRIVAHVRKLSPKPVKAVIITHWHGDHPQGLSEILRTWPQARTIATEATRAHLANPKTMNTPAAPDPEGEAKFRKQLDGFLAFVRDNAAKATDPRAKAGWAASERLLNQYGRDMEGAFTLAPREGFAERLVIDDPTAPVEARFLGRANTDGDAVVWLPRQRIVITGDIVVAPLPFGFGSYPADWRRTLARLGELPFRILVPGHGPPQTDRSYLAKVDAALADVQAQVAPLAAQGLPLAEVAKRIDASGQGARFAGDDPWLRQWFQQYWVTPIVASAYKEARGESIVQGLGGG